MTEIFDKFLIEHSCHSWCMYSIFDRNEDLNGNIIWELQESHSGPYIIVKYNSKTNIFTTSINDHFCHFGNIDRSLYSSDEIRVEDDSRITYYHLTTSSPDVLIKFLFEKK